MSVLTMIVSMTSIVSVSLNQVTCPASGDCSNPGTSSSTNQRSSYSSGYGSNHSSFDFAVLRPVVSPVTTSLSTHIKNAECSDQYNCR
jgi:hypothetical protein